MFFTRMRQRVNAISLTGLVATWLMEVWYILFVGFFSIFFRMNFVREVWSIIKYYEFYFIPLVQIHTSPPIKRYLSSNYD